MGCFPLFGDDLDSGGVRSTARNNSLIGGTLNYGQISVEKFSGGSHGNLQFRLPSQINSFNFVFGGRRNIYPTSKVKSDGWVLPRISKFALVINPESVKMAFDSLERKMKYYNENRRISVDGSIKGKPTKCSTEDQLEYKIPHSLNTVSEYFDALATSPSSSNINYGTAGNQFLYIHYNTAPPSGDNNLFWKWFIQ